ncbi:hypothetical protein WN73_12460 [Bradyrhizobium sp. CCBAU 45394]|nr:hypothetical protein [Bradyrhizobium sp. CCBAU 45394]
MSDWIASWLGFQLPSIPMPQTVKNFDKAVGKILLAAGENAEARIKANTGKAKAKGKIDIDGMYRTAEDKRKLENRAATVQIAVDEMNNKAAQQDAGSEIDDDWLNLYAKIAEDKTSEELQSLFGKILAGEIQRPGTFSLRTLQFLSTLSKSDANEISNFFSYVLFDRIVPNANALPHGPEIHARLLMEELGLASSPTVFSGLIWNISIPANTNIIMTASGFGILIINRTTREINFQLEAQILSTPARELVKIANPPAANFEYIKSVSQIIFEKIRNAGFSEEIVNNGAVAVQAGPLISANTIVPSYVASMPGQAPLS